MSGANYHISSGQDLESERQLKVSIILNLFSNLRSNEQTLADFINSIPTTSEESNVNISDAISIYSYLIVNLPEFA